MPALSPRSCAALRGLSRISFAASGCRRVIRLIEEARQTAELQNFHPNWCPNPCSWAIFTHSSRRGQLAPTQAASSS